jgi:hypothetical protein
VVEAASSSAVKFTAHFLRLLTMKQLVMLLFVLLVPTSAFAQLPHGIPDFHGQDGCETVTTSRDYSTAATAECLVIDSGTTRLLSGAILTTDTILVMPGGTFTMAAGSELRFRDGALLRANDPAEWQRGLICLGTCRLLGTEKTPTARLTVAPVAGATTLTFSSVPSDWVAGNKLALHSSHQPAPSHVAYDRRGETCTIASKTSTTVTCSAPLAYAHPGRSSHLPIVANLTRNTIIRSVNPSGVRGHVALLGTATVEISGVAFIDMGRTTFAPLSATNLIGRYPIHLHHHIGPSTTDPYQFTVSGNVVHGTTGRTEKWGIAVHNSHYGLVEDNVIFQMAGAGIVTEDGSETANVIQNNWVGEVWGSQGYSTDNHISTNRQSTGDWGWEGSCYWFRGPANTVTDNYCGGAIYGLSYVLRNVTVPVPTAKGAVPSRMTNMQTVPLTKLEDIEIAGAFMGVNPWNIGANCCIEVFETAESVMRRMVLWNTRRGYYGYGQNRVTIDGWIQRNDPAYLGNPNELSYGLWWGDYLARNVIIRNATIEDVRTGIIAPFKTGDTRDIYGNAAGTTLIESSTIRAVRAVYTATMYGVTGGGATLPPRLVTVRNSTLVAVTGTGSGWVVREHRPTGYPNPNTTVSDVVRLENVNSLTGYVYYAVQEAQNLYGGIAPCNDTHVSIVGLFCDTPGEPPPAAVEICGDGIDNDGDMAIDENCPVNCVMSDWSAYSAWTSWVTNGDGTESRTRTRTRTITTAAANGGTACLSTSETETETRDEPEEVAVDCAVSAWSDWSDWVEINSTTEQRIRTRTVTTPAENGGATCPPLSETETRLIVDPPTEPEATAPTGILQTCAVRLSAVKPISLVGTWRVQYFANDRSITSSSTTVTRTGVVQPGISYVHAKWTKSGQTPELSASLVVNCRLY